MIRTDNPKKSSKPQEVSEESKSKHSNVIDVSDYEMQDVKVINPSEKRLSREAMLEKQCGSQSSQNGQS